MPSSLTLLVATAGAALCAVAAVSASGLEPLNKRFALEPSEIISSMTRPIARWEMPPALRELSGLAVNSAGELLAHDDENGVVFVLAPTTGNVLRSFSLGAPAPKDDFEGIAVAGERIFLMTSSGFLYETREPTHGAIAKVSIKDTGLGQLCELEGLAYDTHTHDLLIGCKVPYAKQLRDRVTILRWSLDNNAPTSPIFITRANVGSAKLDGSKSGSSKRRDRLRFSPSALEYDPASSHIVLVAGIEHALLEITHDGHIAADRSLSKSSHRQPESLTFIGDSLILVGDEGASGRATISVYQRDPLRRDPHRRDPQ